MEASLRGKVSRVITLEPVTAGTVETYCRIGANAYTDHYLHLWPGQDASPYLNTSFIPSGVQSELRVHSNLHFIVRLGETGIGIAKLILNRRPEELDLPAPVFLEKVYLLKKQTGKGYGEQILSALHGLSAGKGMKYIYLTTMQKGKALSFYRKMGYEILREELLPFEHAIPEERGMYLLGRPLV